MVLVILTVASNVLYAQMPANLDFSSGNFSNWLCYTGTAGTGTAATGTAFTNAVLSGPVAGPPSRHALTSGPGIDPVGQLLAVAPGGGNYSLRIGNTSVGAQAEAVRYYLHVPAGTTHYSVLYQFAVVLNDGGWGHGSQIQASFMWWPMILRAARSSLPPTIYMSTQTCPVSSLTQGSARV